MKKVYTFLGYKSSFLEYTAQSVRILNSVYRGYTAFLKVLGQSPLDG